MQDVAVYFKEPFAFIFDDQFKFLWRQPFFQNDFGVFNQPPPVTLCNEFSNFVVFHFIAVVAADLQSVIVDKDNVSFQIAHHDYIRNRINQP